MAQQENDMWPWIYTAGTIVIGLIFYWLRSNHRAVYGFSEILVAFGLMFLKYWPHGVGVLAFSLNPPPTFLDALAAEAVPFFVTVYVFVRGCDNLIGGLREPEH
jgi:hypothetical protein